MLAKRRYTLLFLEQGRLCLKDEIVFINLKCSFPFDFKVYGDNTALNIVLFPTSKTNDPIG